MTRTLWLELVKIVLEIINQVLSIVRGWPG